MLWLLGARKIQIRECLFWMTMFSLLCRFLTAAAIENHIVLLFQDQYLLKCGEISTDVDWAYRQQENDNPILIADLEDTSYIATTNNLLITNIKAEHEGYYSCNQVSTLFHLIVYAVPRFVGCSQEICSADKVNQVTEGDNIRFILSVVYIPGGPSGMEQIIRLVRLETSSTLVNCLQTNLNNCVINQMNPIHERVTYSRNGSNPWFGIEINITNAELSDSRTYTMLLEAQDLSNTDVVMRRTSVVEVLVTPSPTPTVISTPVSTPFPSSSLSLSMSGEMSSSPSLVSVGSTSSFSTQSVSSSVHSEIESTLVTASSMTAEPQTENPSKIQGFVIAIALSSVGLILVVLGLVVVIVVVFKKKEKPDLKPKMVELTSSKSREETKVFFESDKATVSTYITEDKQMSYSISFVRSNAPSDSHSLASDCHSLPRSSLILVEHLNSDPVPV